MPTDKQLLSNVAIVLVHPRVPENIGAAARVAWNMGIERLIVVRDDLPAREPMAKMATHHAVHLVEQAVLFPTLREALAPFQLAVATTARRGRQRCAEKSPREIFAEVLPQLANNQLAIVFGPEDTGLTNEELQLCQYASAIPTADFSSLNLAQAVGIHCHELYYSLIHAPKELVYAPQLASSHELESMYDHLQESLKTIDFLNELSSAHWMGNMRRFFSRLQLTSKETNIVRGICKKFLLHQESKQPPGARHP